MKMSRNILAASGIIYAAATLAANATIVLTDLGAGQYKVVMSPTTFEVTTGGKGNRVVIEDFFATASTGGGTAISGTVEISVNGGTAYSVAFETNNGVFDGAFGEFEPTDLLLNFTNDYDVQGVGTFNPGDQVTYSTSNMVFQPVEALPALSTASEFNALLLNYSSSIASATEGAGAGAEVPLPASALLLIGGVGALAARARRRG